MNITRWATKFAKLALAKSPYRVIRRGLGHRFQAIEDLLWNIKQRGLEPSVIIDGGANVGEFSRLARKTWVQARIVMVEPQPACEVSLRALATKGGFDVVMAALGREKGTLRLAATSTSTSTGAYVIGEDQATSGSELKVPVVTLEDLIVQVGASGPIFLKLDLKGYELTALQGAGPALDRVDAVLTEASFYTQAYEPSIAALFSFFDERGFELHDIAALAGRRRDGRAHQADLFFVRRGSLLTLDTNWS